MKPGAHIVMWAPGFIVPSIYGYKHIVTAVSLNIALKLATKYPCRYFYSVPERRLQFCHTHTAAFCDGIQSMSTTYWLLVIVNMSTDNCC